MSKGVRTIRGGYDMAKFRCNICGFIYDEEKEGVAFEKITECPICHQKTTEFSLYEEVERETNSIQQKPQTLDYQKEYVRHDETTRYMEEIHQMAVSGKSIHKLNPFVFRSRKPTAFRRWEEPCKFVAINLGSQCTFV